MNINHGVSINDDYFQLLALKGGLYDVENEIHSTIKY